MSKQSQKKIIQINHALSGIHGEEMKTVAFRITESRKEILKKLQRKKRLSSIIHDELYGYLEKFPEEKLGLHQEQFKKKKARLAEFEERAVYRNPALVDQFQKVLAGGIAKEMKTMCGVWKYPIYIDTDDLYSTQD